MQGLHYSFQTRDKLYFVLDYVNGGEVAMSMLLQPSCENYAFAFLLMS